MTLQFTQAYQIFFDSIKKSLILSVNGQQELAATKNEGERK
jgi:hypothetical protein